MNQYLLMRGGAGKLWQKYLFGFFLGLILTIAGTASAGGRFYFTTILTNSTYADGRNSGPEHISDTGYISGPAPFGDAWQAARWNPQGVICELGVYDTDYDVVSDAFGLNDSGDIAGYSSHDELSADNAVVFRGTNVVRVPLDDAGQAKAINNGGCAVGYVMDFLSRPIAYIWDGASTNVEYLGDMPYDDDTYVAANAEAINVHTQVVGKALNQTQSQSRAFIWTPANGLTLLPAIDGRTVNSAIKINASGALLGYSANGGNEDRISWVRNTAGTISILPDTSTVSNHNLLAMNDFGVIVGTSQTSGAEQWRGVIYDSIRSWRFLREMIASDMSRYNIDHINANGINNRGQIVGSIIGNDNHYYGALFTPVAGRRNDFDGDGKSDPALYDPVSGVWLVFQSGSNYALGTLTLGGAGLPPFAADFDGDGKADPAVYDELSAVLSVRLSNCSYALMTVTGFGGVGFAAVSADLDGDGKADPVVYEETTGTWLYLLSNQSYAPAGIRGFGGLGFVPAPADYDGDQKTDLAVYHETSGSWFIRSSTNSASEELYVALGGPGYEVVYGDYDGDSLIDPATYNESTGHWMIQMSQSGRIEGTLFGGPGMASLPVDYDGDGKSDPAVFREADAFWFAALSESGYATQTACFGGAGSGYIPVR